MNTRKYWVDMMLKTVKPVLVNLSNAELKQNMPVNCRLEKEVRRRFTYLEAFGRAMCGITPWLENTGLSGEEEELRQKTIALVLKCIDNATDPASPDFMNFSEGRQPVVDAAFLAQALLRAPTQILDALDSRVRANLAACMESSRNIKPGYNNFILFSGIIEALLYKMGAWWDSMRTEYALRMTDNWYKGDGMYGDGPEFCFDYYNSFVIGPMISDMCEVFCDTDKDWAFLRPIVKERAQRYAAIQERLINPDGSFPAVGRSLAYRTGAFHHLAQMALQHNLPEEVSPAQVRCALTAMLKKVMEADGVFDSGGWLQVGLYGYQPNIGEIYISTGSLYLCSAVYLPLGLSPKDSFWAGEAAPWTSCKIWGGEDVKPDKALHIIKHQTIYDHDDYIEAGKEL